MMVERTGKIYKYHQSFKRTCFVKETLIKKNQENSPLLSIHVLKMNFPITAFPRFHSMQ